MKTSAYVLLIVVAAAAATSCAHRDPSVQAVAKSLRDERASYVERRSAELIRRGAPREAALARATSEWMQNHLAGSDRDRRTAEQRRLEEQLARDAHRGALP